MKRGAKLALLALGLLASHAAVFLLSRGANAGSGGRDAGGDGSVEWRAPGKSVDRGELVAGNVGQGFARLLDELEKAGLDEEAFAAVRTELFREWIRRDLRGAMDRLLGPLYARRYAECANEPEIRKELMIAIAADSRAVWGWIESRHYGSASATVARRWLGAVMWDGQGGLVLELLPGMPGFCRQDALEAVAGQGTPEDLVKLRGMFGRMGIKEGPVVEVNPAEDPFASDPEAAQGYVKNYYAGSILKALRERQEGPAAFYAGETDASLRDRFTKQWAEAEIAPLPPTAAVQALLALPEAERYTAARALLENAQRADMPRMVALLEGLAAAGLLDPTQAPEGGSQQRSMAFAAVNRALGNELGDVESGYRALAGIADPELRRMTLEVLAVNSPAAELLENAGRIPAGADRDWLFFNAALRSGRDLEDREKLAAEIGDADLAERVRKRIEKDE